MKWSILNEKYEIRLGYRILALILVIPCVICLWYCWKRILGL
jgi:hypothetical protein